MSGVLIMELSFVSVWMVLGLAGAVSQWLTFGGWGSRPVSE